MDVILYILVIIVIGYVIHHIYTFKKVEHFYTEQPPTQPNINLESNNMTIASEALLNELKILKANLPKTNEVTLNSLEGSNNKFMPYFVNNMENILKLQKQSQDAFKAEQSDKINKLKSQAGNFRDILEIEAGRDKSTIHSIVSNQDGQPLTIVPVANDRHLVIVNNKCMSTDTVNNYDLYACNYQDPKQHFQLETVYHDTDYNLNLAPSTPRVIQSTDDDKDNINYPFFLVKSFTSGNCLSNKNSNLTIEPCHATKTQRWTASNNLLTCNKIDDANLIKTPQ
jgi:hypothetical protein